MTIELMVNLFFAAGACAEVVVSPAAAVVAPAAAASGGGVSGWLFGLLMGCGGTSLIVLAIKKLVLPRYAALVRDTVNKALNPTTPDPQLNVLLRAHALTGVKLAEYLIPDRGKGCERFALVDAWLAKAHIPEPIRKLLIEEAVYTMDDELRAAAAVADGPAGQQPVQ